MDKRIRKQFHVVPTFDSIEQEYDEEQVKDPGPGLARQATDFVLSQFYTRMYDDAMQEPSAQKQALAGALKPVASEAAPVGTPGPPGPQGPPGAPGSTSGADLAPSRLHIGPLGPVWDENAIQLAPQGPKAWDQGRHRAWDHWTRAWSQWTRARDQ